MAAESYAEEHNYKVASNQKAAIMEQLKLNFNIDFDEETALLLVTLDETIKIDLNTETGVKVGSFVVHFDTGFTIDFDFAPQITIKDSKFFGFLSVEQLEYINFRIVQTFKTNFNFEVKLQMDVESNEFYLLNHKTRKIHLSTCRMANNVKNKNDLTYYTEEELMNYFGTTWEDSMQQYECGVCKAVSRIQNTCYIINTDSKMVHIQNCSKAKNIAVDNKLYVWNLPTIGYSYCDNCNPNKQDAIDFEKRMLESMQSEDWSETLGDLQEYLKKAGFEKKDANISIVPTTKIPVFYVFEIAIDIDLIFEFDLQAVLEYNFDCQRVDVYGIEYKAGEFIPYYTPGTAEKSTVFDLQGKANCRLGANAHIYCGIFGLSDWVNVGVEAETGLYAEMSGVLHHETITSVDDGINTHYYAAYFEAGLYFDLNLRGEFLNFGKNFDFFDGKIPLIAAGYNKAYYAYQYYDNEISVSGKRTDLNQFDLFHVNYFDLKKMEKQAGVLKAEGEENQYSISYQFFNEDGTENPYCKVENGILIISDDAPISFDVTMCITIVGGDGKCTTFADFLKHQYVGESSIFFLDENYVTVHCEKNSLPDDAVYYNGHYYKVYDIGLTWDEAKAYCEKLGGHLATITSQNEQTFVETLIPQYDKNNYWLGGFKSNSQWKWITNEAFVFENWAMNEPNNHPTSGGEDKLHMYNGENPMSYSVVGEWNDLNANGTSGNELFFGLDDFGFICEWDGMESEGLEYALSAGGTDYIVSGIGTCKDTKLIIPSVYNGKPVVKIAESAFKGCKQLKSVVIPDSVTEIGKGAFSGCSNIESMTIPFVGASINPGSTLHNEKNCFGYIFGSEQYEGSYVAYQTISCINSRAFYIPDMLNKITLTGDKIPYSGFSQLKVAEIILLGNVTSIPTSAFEGNTELKKIKIPRGCTEIGFVSNGMHSGRVFSSCTNLQKVYIPLSLKNIDYNCFGNGNNITDVYYEGSETDWKKIQMDTFNESLQNATIHYNYDYEQFEEQEDDIDISDILGEEFKGEDDFFDKIV